VKQWARRGLGVAILCGLAPSAASAHSFGTPYILPIPYWIYVYGCGAALIVTFALLGVLADGAAIPKVRRLEVGKGPAARTLGSALLMLLRAGSVGCLLFTIAAGFVGSSDPGVNIGMSLFWVFFLLGFAYVTLVSGDLYEFINPWRLLVSGLERLGFDLSTPRTRYPVRLGCWPAFVAYVCLVFVELFVSPRPLTLSLLLLGYTALTFAGVVLFGREAWFSRADLFGLYFRLTGRREKTVAHLRVPLSAAIERQPRHLSVIVFVLFMLSSTAYDGIYDTQLWTAAYWRALLWLSELFWGDPTRQAQELLMSGFLAYRKAGLCLFPFVYLLLYVLALYAAKALTKTAITVRQLMNAFCYSLLPIGVAYNFAHYYTLLLSQIASFRFQIADPLGFGWNLLGLADGSPSAGLPMGAVWHTQVAAILVGHVASVVVAHYAALKVFRERRQVILSQAPMLFLMVAYTFMGLWILTLPLGGD
jgi:hypothetical protein